MAFYSNRYKFLSIEDDDEEEDEEEGEEGGEEQSKTNGTTNANINVQLDPDNNNYIDPDNNEDKEFVVVRSRKTMKAEANPEKRKVIPTINWESKYTAKGNPLNLIRL